MQNSVLKQTIIHGLEALGVCILVWILDFFIIQIAPQLPQTAILGILIPVLSAVAKNLRANPKIPIPDYVSGQR